VGNDDLDFKASVESRRASEIIKEYLKDEEDTSKQHESNSGAFKKQRISERIWNMQLDSKGSDVRSRFTKTDGLASIASSTSGGQLLGRPSVDKQSFPPVQCVIVDTVKHSLPAQR
jgi:hypothetical protein